MKNFRCEKHYHEKPRIDVGICRGFDFLVEAIFLKYFGLNETELTTLKKINYFTTSRTPWGHRMKSAVNMNLKSFTKK